MAEDLESIVAAGAAAALTELDGKLPEPVDTKVAETQPAAVDPADTTKVELPTKEELDDLGLTKQQQVEARQLFAGLQDPTKAPIIIEFLAKNAGFTKENKPETKAEVKEAAKGMVAELTEALGPELAYLAEKMGPVFEKHLKEQAEELVKPLRGRLDEQDLQALRNEGDRVQHVLATKFFGGKELPDNVVTKMSEVMNTYNAVPGQAMEDYLENVLFIATGKLGITLKVGVPQQKPNQDRAERSRSNAPANLETRAKPTPGEKSIHPSRQQALSLEDSIHQALEQSKTELTK